MEKFHWDYWTYINQPPHLIQNLLEMSICEADYLDKQNKK